LHQWRTQVPRLPHRGRRGSAGLSRTECWGGRGGAVGQIPSTKTPRFRLRRPQHAPAGARRRTRFADGGALAATQSALPAVRTTTHVEGKPIGSSRRARRGAGCWLRMTMPPPAGADNLAARWRGGRRRRPVVLSQGAHARMGVPRGEGRAVGATRATDREWRATESDRVGGRARRDQLAPASTIDWA
jgi:hypothetical protein